MGRALARWEAFCADLSARSAPAVEAGRSSIVLGRDRHGRAVLLPQRPRLEHSHVIGTTGGGKSKFVEHCVRQDIANGSGVLVVDPHGEHPASLYRSLLSWLDQKGYANRRTIHLIDPNSPTHTVGFNPLARPDPETDISVIAGVVLEAFERAWGDQDMTQKPTIERVLMMTFAALAELGLTLAEAPLLLDRRDHHGLRAHALAKITDRYTHDELQRLHELSLDERRRHDFDLEIIGPVNRLARFLRPAAIRAMVGQTERIFDFRETMDEGHVVLCNLSGGDRVYERDADLLGRLITRMCFFHAKRRRVPEKPFFIYLDECHRYLSGDLENILAEIRKFGCATILCHQWLQQMGDDDDNMLAAVRNATNFKVVFRIKDPVEAEELAHAVVPLDLEMPVRALIKPAVVGHRRVRVSSASMGGSVGTSASRSESEGESDSMTNSTTRSTGKTSSHGTSYSVGDSISIGESTSTAESRSVSAGESMAIGESSTYGNTTGVSHASGSGSAAGTSAGQTMLPVEEGFFATPEPTVLAVSEGSSSMSHSSEMDGANSSTSRATGRSSARNFSNSHSAGTTIGAARSKGRTIGITKGTSSSHAVAVGSAEGTAFSCGRNRATTTGSAETRGTSWSDGTQEAFEPLYAELPTAMHGKENVLYMAAHTLRNLATGQAFINYVGASGMMSALLTVPRISEYPISADAFASLRARVLSKSNAAMPIAEAARLIAEREHNLLAARKAIETPEPESFRTQAPIERRPEREHSRPDAAGRVPSRSFPTARKSVR